MNNRPLPPSTAPAVVGFDHPRVFPHQAAARVIAITQVVIGVVLLSVGSKIMASTDCFWVRSTGAGIWIGAWVMMAGFVGVALSRSPSNSCLSGVYKSMNIMTTVADFVAGSFFLTATSVYFGDKCTTCHANHGQFYFVLFALSVAEWCVALVAAILCSYNEGHPRSQLGVIIEQPTLMVTGPRRLPLVIGSGSIATVERMHQRTSYGDTNFVSIPGSIGIHAPCNNCSKDPSLRTSLPPSSASAPPACQSTWRSTLSHASFFRPQVLGWSTAMSPGAAASKVPSGHISYHVTGNNAYVPANSFTPRAPGPMWSATGYSEDMVPPPYAE